MGRGSYCRETMQKRQQAKLKLRLKNKADRIRAERKAAR